MTWRRKLFLGWCFVSVAWMTFVALGGWILSRGTFPPLTANYAVVYYPAEDRVENDSLWSGRCRPSAPVEYMQPIEPPGPVFEHISAKMLITCEPEDTPKEKRWIMQIGSDEEIRTALSHVESLMLQGPHGVDPTQIFVITLYGVYAIVPPLMLLAVGGLTVWVVSRFLALTRRSP